MEINIYIIAFAILFLIWFRINSSIKKARVNFKYVFAHYTALFVFIFLLFPPCLNALCNLLNIENQQSFVVLIMIMYLFYVSFIDTLAVAELNRKTEILASEVSLLKKQTEDK